MVTDDKPTGRGRRRLKQKLPPVEPGRGGSKPYEFSKADRQTIEALAAYLPQADIAAHFDGIDLKTLRKHCGVELKRGKAKANARVGKTLYDMTQDKKHKGQVAATIFWAKTQLGFSEKLLLQKAGGTLNPGDLDLSGLTADELDTMESILAKCGPALADSSGTPEA